MRVFFCEPDEIAPRAIQLGAAERHHARSVLRLKKGEVVRVLDGHGRAFEGALDPGTGRITIEKEADSQAPQCGVTLAVALIKGDRWEWLIEKTVEIGATRIVPLLTQHGVVRIAPADFEKKRQRWRQIAIAALKQSGQRFLPGIDLPVSVQDFCVAAAPARPSAGDEARWMLSERGGTPLRTVLRPELRDVTLLVGPEGGWADEEFDAAARHSFAPVSLGSQVFRAETAPLYALSAIHFMTENGL